VKLRTGISEFEKSVHGPLYYAKPPVITKPFG